MFMKGCRWRWWAAGVLALALLSSAVEESSTLFPTPTISPTPSPSPSPSPPPTPANTSGIVNITEPNCLYILIEKISFNFDSSSRFPNVSTRSLAHEAKGHLSHNLTGHCSDKNSHNITFTQYYGQPGKELFNFTMILHSEPSSGDQLWYMESFRHQNLSQKDVIFQYTGVQQSIKASGEITYYCENLTFSGQSSDGVHSILTFHNLTIQAFNLEGSKPSKTFSVCGLKSQNNATINITIGLVVGVTIVLALIVIIITLLIRKLRNKGYDLLKDY